MNNLIQTKNLKKKFNLSNNKELIIFDNLNLNITNNSITSIVGPSGCGKSTLLNILGFLDSDYLGDYIFDGNKIQNINENILSNIRNQNIGFIHQFFHLIPELSVLENIILPGLINNNKESLIFKEASILLDSFEMFEKKNIKPNKLSGGEQQRVAIARSLINRPNLILADEMTGNLDEKTADEIIIFFLKFIEKHNTALIFATHNIKYARMANAQYELTSKNLRIK
jgi:ABC-type lipoprotein export system ATPase subunit